jgi:lipopolysaccharide/colanic/teichoic acid biosynthesis glycosyltransferase
VRTTFVGAALVEPVIPPYETFAPIINQRMTNRYCGDFMNLPMPPFASEQTDLPAGGQLGRLAVRSAPQKLLESEALIWLVQAILSIAGLLFLSPLMAIIAVVVKFTDAGPIFYRGERVGRAGRIFRIYKFRTLIVGAEEKIGARLLEKTDQTLYYTRIGRLLKRSKLDELPQLLNVIRGEMRFAGPRPVRPVFVDQLIRTIPRYSARFLVPPGITGIAQLRGGYYTAPRNKLRYDLIYIRRRSLLLDLQLVFFTLVKILNRWLSGMFFVLFFFIFASFMPLPLQQLLYVSILGVEVSLFYLFIVVVAGGFFIKKSPAQIALYRVPLNRPLFV